MLHPEENINLVDFKLPKPDTRLVVFGDAVFKLKYKMRSDRHACWSQTLRPCWRHAQIIRCLHTFLSAYSVENRLVPKSCFAKVLSSRRVSRFISRTICTWRSTIAVVLTLKTRLNRRSLAVVWWFVAEEDLVRSVGMAWYSHVSTSMYISRKQEAGLCVVQLCR